MKLYLFGGGGHARVILDLLHAQGRTVTAILDDHPEERREVLGVPVLLAGEALRELHPDRAQFLVAIGDGAARRRTAEALAARGFGFFTATAPSAVLGSETVLGPGTVVMPQAVINQGSRLGRHVILNTGATVDHDCRIGDFCHIAPGCTLCGGVVLGEGVMLGVGGKIGPGVKIGAGCLIGAGSVVLHDLPPRCTAWGVPARVVRGPDSHPSDFPTPA